MFFGDAYINIISAELLSSVRRQAEGARRSGSQNDDIFVLFDFMIQVVKGNVVVIFFIAELKAYFAALNIKGQVPVPLFFVFFGKFVSFGSYL